MAADKSNHFVKYKYFVASVYSFLASDLPRTKHQVRFNWWNKDEQLNSKRKTQASYPTVENVKKSQPISGRRKFPLLYDELQKFANVFSYLVIAKRNRPI